MYVYRTAQFTHKAGRYGIQPQISRLVVELETQNLDEVQAHFKRVYPYLKRKADNNLRLIGLILTVDDTLVLCLLDILTRGGKDYEHFLLNPQEFGKTHLNSHLDEEELHRWLISKQSEGSVPNLRQPLPEELRPWLEPPGWEMEVDNEAQVYESEEWLTRFNSPEIQKNYEIYNTIIESIATRPGNAEKIAQWAGVSLSGEQNLYVLYSFIETADIPTRKVLFLLAPFDRKPSLTEIAQIGQATDLFDRSKNVFSRRLRVDELTRFARRSYPDYLLADVQGWLALESDRETNLALSAEEESLLNSVSIPRPAVGEPRAYNSLPIFLNGQAGSGKSTMLSYLFADYCYRKYYNERGKRRESPLPGNPLFLTYNERLLQVVKKWVQTLLSSHHQFIAKRNADDEIPEINDFFQPFQKFLLNLLPPEERERFSQDKYIGFHRFKQLYRNLRLPQLKNYSPELYWHAIRTFIKGYSLKGYMEPEEYQELPRRERTISVERFQGIYETMWERWYKRLTTEQCYWDDQDLIARVLELHCYRPEYTAVFCDEAQDFTRLELQLIVRLSIFSQYDLGNQPLSSLPFAFAGDPFQTLNPTGFRWESVKALFYNEAIAALDPTGKLHLEMNFRELERNYRSSASIVQVSNLIQLWRQVLFNIRELKPQTAWQQGQFSQPQKFILNHNISPEELSSNIRDTIVIVPCEEGEEFAYVQKDEVLSQIIFPSTSSEPPKNVLSAIAAKGLEFKKVILYKFGEACNKAVWKYITKGEQPTAEDEYFFNKLYVAASRATEHLFVVDSETGEQQLWKYASNKNYLELFLQRSVNRVQWQEGVQPIRTGTAETAREMRDRDPQSTAQELKTKGFDAKNPSLLRRAKQFYSDLGDIAEAAICDAWALKFEERFREAGSRFLQLGDVDRAWECFWEGMCWLELMAWYNEHPNSRQREFPIVNFMAQPADNLDALGTFTQFLTECFASNELQRNRFSLPWKTAVQEYARRIKLLISAEKLTPHEWLRFGNVLEALGQMAGKAMLEIAGACFYRAKRYKRAVLCWERCGSTGGEYYLAKAVVLGKPDGLEYLEKAGKPERIIIEWKNAGFPRDPEWLRYVAPALERKNLYHTACIGYLLLDNSAKVKACFERISQGVPKIKLLKLMVQYFIRQQYWSDAIEAVERYLPGVISESAEKTQLKCELVYQVARSPRVEMSKEHRERYEKFIKEEVLASSDWRKYLFVQQVGVALEKIGALVETLRFYEGFVGVSHRKLRQFARDRWLAVKSKQVDYFRSSGQSDKAEKSRSEVVQYARKWRIAVESVSLEPPPVTNRRQPNIASG